MASPSRQDRTALDASLDRAAREGIPVTVFDSGVDSTNYMTFVATNNYEAGQMGARKLAELLNGKGSIAMVLHVPGSFSTMERERGFEDTMAQELPHSHRAEAVRHVRSLQGHGGGGKYPHRASRP